MSAPNTTPGPWRVIFYDAGDCDHYDHNGPCPSIQAPDEQDCAIVHWDGFKQQYWSSANGNQRQIEANAHLIAAAPELYEALEDARTSLSITRTNIMCEIGHCADPSESPWAGVPEVLAQRIAKIDTALSRARGEVAK